MTALNLLLIDAGNFLQEVPHPKSQESNVGSAGPGGGGKLPFSDGFDHLRIVGVVFGSTFLALFGWSFIDSPWLSCRLSDDSLRIPCLISRNTAAAGAAPSW